MRYDPLKHHRASTRLRGFDYTKPGAYFITICTFERECLFGEVVGGEMRLNQIGEIAGRCWLEIPAHYQRVNLDEFQIMPNHIHGIILIMPVGARHAQGQIVCRGLINQTPTWPLMQDPRVSLGKIMRHFKARTAREIDKGGWHFFQWQRNYHDRIIRSTKELENVRNYIRENPAKWEHDEDNPLNIVQHKPE